MPKLINTISILTMIFIYACSSKPPKSNPQTGSDPQSAKEGAAISTPSMEARQLANEQETPLFTEFEFKKGSAELTAESRKKLQKLGKEAMAKGKIDVIKVISWGDQEYPSAKKKKLNEEQRVLAKNRNSEIKNYLSSISSKLDHKKVELISMAERPDFFSKLTSTDQTRIKKSLESAGVPDTENKSKLKSKLSRSIVIIKMEENKHK